MVRKVSAIYSSIYIWIYRSRRASSTAGRFCRGARVTRRSHVIGDGGPGREFLKSQCYAGRSPMQPRPVHDWRAPPLFVYKYPGTVHPPWSAGSHWIAAACCRDPRWPHDEIGQPYLLAA